MADRLILPRAILNEMIEYVADRVPLEACGLLAGIDGLVGKMIGVQNQAQSEVRFVMEPYEQLKAFQWIESNGLELLGIFHSHPAGPETASPTDIAEAAYAVAHVILSRRGKDWAARGFRIENGEATETELHILE